MIFYNKTDVFGTFTLLEACRKFDISKQVQNSIDEVYVSIESSSFKESDHLNPSYPNSASKVSADLLVNTIVTYGLPVCVTRSSDNFDPFQYPEKLIPFFVIKAISNKKLPLYGDGLNVRDWLYVNNNCRSIDIVKKKGSSVEIYNIGANNEHTNLEITNIILEELKKPSSLIHYVKDLLGHDRRYSVNYKKIKKKSDGCVKSNVFKKSIRETIQCYVKINGGRRNLFYKLNNFMEYFLIWYING